MRTSPYGTWKSPLSAADTIGGVVAFGLVQVDGEDVYWLEGRPEDGGRQVLVRRDAGGRIEDMTPAPTYVRTLVHEYGGGAYVAGGGRVVYSELSDQRLYELGRGPLTEEPAVPRGWRYADARLLPDGSIVCVGESHTHGEAMNDLALITPTGEMTVLTRGRDFYSNPRPSADGSRLLWLEWDHPNMPWDGTELMTGRLVDGSLTEVTKVAGGVDESIFQPEWAPDGGIVFVSDRTGWWNLYSSKDGVTTPLRPAPADYGLPAWVFGYRTYGFLANGRMLAGFWQDGVQKLEVIHPDGSATALPTGYTRHDYLITDGVSRAWFAGTAGTMPSAICELDTTTGEVVIIRSNPMPVPPDHVPVPRVISFPTGTDAVAHAVFYPPLNPEHDPPEGELPPLIVTVHGGPTSHVVPRLNAEFLYWTTRGFAVVDVNYRGSTGYGREYRNMLRDNWGITDVEDCVAAARHLADIGEVDPDRLLITGGSAGGYTTLAALAFTDAFAAGASYYGVADIALLNEHTHKFESRYCDRLTGTDPTEIRRRSPLYSADRITVPVILFQGLEDKVVPPEQAEVIAAALAENGVPHALIMYEGEDHGFRKAGTIVNSLESELVFYGKVLGFTPAGDLGDVRLS
ncbi:MAG: prolyl oligopeptidase family serine peptidase [Actinobacteria bacterium]|nr:prolyl oligopeptidase family serine peptidase [Actinomycetota bacterium]